MSKRVAEQKEKTVKQKENEIKVNQEEFNKWVQSLYEVSNYTEEEIHELYETFKYQGFNRDEVLKQLFSLIQDIKLVSQIVVACGLRGPKQASLAKLSNGKTVEQMGISANGGKGTKKLTCGKINAATADLTAYLLKKMNVPKRLPKLECPGYLQFPAAGSIKLPEDLRRQHKTFAEEFSKVLPGGSFDENIYLQMEQNAYLSMNIGNDLFR